MKPFSDREGRAKVVKLRGKVISRFKYLLVVQHFKIRRLQFHLKYRKMLPSQYLMRIN